MKKLILLQFSIFLIGHFMQAQDSSWLLVNDTTVNKKKIKINVELTDHSNSKGWLTGITDSSIFISEKAIPFSPNPEAQANLREMSISKIKTIKIHMEGKGGRGALAGALIGGALGIPLGIAAASTATAFETWGQTDPGSSSGNGGMALVTVLASAGTGALIGGVVGSVSYKAFRIDGDSHRLTLLDQFIAKRIYKVEETWKVKK